MIRIAIALVCLFAPLSWGQSKVTIKRLPPGAVQPQVAVDAQGVAHLIYLKGDPAHCDVFYVRSSDDRATWTKPLKVNTQDGSAIALGTVRGAQLALGRGGRVHVAWMGSSAAENKVEGKFAPMLYARMKDDGSGFEREKNVIVKHPGLDGGGSVAADELGNVFVGWHAPEVMGAGEQSRRVWIARSNDEGKSFEPEVGVSDPATGGCGCCGMQMTVAEGRLLVLYRGAAQVTHRGMFLLDVGADLQGAHSREIAPMEVGTCIMSTAAFGMGPGGVAMAWETNGRVGWQSIAKGQAVHEPTQAGQAQKHPALAINGNGDVLFVWTEGTGWNRGGSVRWEGYSASGTAIPGLVGDAGDLGVWGSVAAFSTGKGDFVIVY